MPRLSLADILNYTKKRPNIQSGRFMNFAENNLLFFTLFQAGIRNPYAANKKNHAEAHNQQAEIKRQFHQSMRSESGLQACQ